MMEDKSKNVWIVVLIVLCIMFLGIIISLTISYRAKQDEAIYYYKQIQAQQQAQPAASNPTEITLEHSKKLYEDAGKLCWRHSFKTNTTEEEVERNGEKIQAVEILDFDEAMRNVFSKSGTEKFLTKTGAFKYNGKIYWIAADRGSDISYVSTELTLKNKTEKRVEYTAKSIYVADETYNGAAEFYTGNKFKTVENPFVVVHENGRWLVEEFTLAY